MVTGCGHAHQLSQEKLASRAGVSAASGNVCLAGGVTSSRALGGESLGVRSTVVGFPVVGVQAVEEFPDRPLGSEHVKGHMLTVLRDDFVFALRL